MNNYWRLCGVLTLSLLEFGDWLSTKLVIGHGGFEQNPLVAHAGLGTTKLLAFALCLALVWRASRPRTLLLAVLPCSAVLAWNFGLLVRG